jgi:hypothetical protein
MNSYVKGELRDRAAKLADLIVKAKPAQIRFRSEEQFLEMLGLPPRQLQHRVPVRVRQLKY